MLSIYVSRFNVLVYKYFANHLNILSLFFNPKTEAASSETSVDFQRTTQRYNSSYQPPREHQILHLASGKLKKKKMVKITLSQAVEAPRVVRDQGSHIT
jgi:hypothetical protein